MSEHDDDDENDHKDQSNTQLKNLKLRSRLWFIEMEIHVNIGEKDAKHQWKRCRKESKEGWENTRTDGRKSDDEWNHKSPKDTENHASAKFYHRFFFLSPIFLFIPDFSFYPRFSFCPRFFFLSLIYLSIYPRFSFLSLIFLFIPDFCSDPVTFMVCTVYIVN